MPATGSAAGGAVPVVLVHGFGQSAHAWDAVAETLRAGGCCEVATFELAGHGERRATGDSCMLANREGSPGCGNPEGCAKGDVAELANPAAFDLAAQGEALLAFLEGFEQPPVLVGYSMGGRVALQALVDAPKRFAACVRALVLESCGLGPATEEERAAAAARDAANAQRLREAGVQAFMDAWEQLPLFATQRELPADVRKRVRVERLANSAEALALTFERAGQHAMPGRTEVLRALRDLTAARVSLLYVAGERDEKYSALADILASELVEAQTAESSLVTVTVIPQAGHNVHLEQPEAFCNLVRKVAECAE